jgi:tetratricopeptide (TPR) repeat protein
MAGVFLMAWLGTDAGASLRDEGLAHGYNLEYAAALDTFRAAIALDPEDGNAHRLAAATIWMQILFLRGAVTVEDYLGQAQAKHKRAAPPADLEKAFYEHLARADAIAESRLRADATDVDARYQRGAAAGLRASYIATVEGRVRDSLGSAKRAYTEHTRVLALDPSRKDAGLIVGTYQYAVASLSLPLRLLARLRGFGSGKASGIRLVEDAARYPGHVQTSAQFMLVLFYNRERRYADALEVLRVLQARYPRNYLLAREIESTTLRAKGSR